MSTYPSVIFRFFSSTFRNLETDEYMLSTWNDHKRGKVVKRLEAGSAVIPQTGLCEWIREPSERSFSWPVAPIAQHKSENVCGQYCSSLRDVYGFLDCAWKGLQELWQITFTWRLCCSLQALHSDCTTFCAFWEPVPARMQLQSAFKMFAYLYLIFPLTVYCEDFQSWEDFAVNTYIPIIKGLPLKTLYDVCFITSNCLSINLYCFRMDRKVNVDFS